MKFRINPQIKIGQIYKARYERASCPEWHGIYKIRIIHDKHSGIYKYMGEVIEIIDSGIDSRIALRLGFSEANIREFFK